MTEQINKKYEFVEGDTINFDEKTLKRIRAIRDFGNVKKGDLGGYIEKEENLSHEGDCWVGDRAKVYGDSRVYEDALVCGEAKVRGEAQVYGDAKVCCRAKVSQDAKLCGDIAVTDSY